MNQKLACNEVVGTPELFNISHRFNKTQKEEGAASKAQALRLDESETDCIMVSVLRRKKKGEKNKDLTS